jgi:hypothetical protein
MEFVSSYELLWEFGTTKIMALENYGAAADSVLIIRVSSAHAKCVSALGIKSVGRVVGVPIITTPNS